MPVGLLVVGGESGVAVDDPRRFRSASAEQASHRSRWNAEYACDGPIGRALPCVVQTMQDIRHARVAGTRRRVESTAVGPVTDRTEPTVHAVNASCRGHEVGRSWGRRWRTPAGTRSINAQVIWAGRIDLERPEGVKATGDDYRTRLTSGDLRSCVSHSTAGVHCVGCRSVDTFIGYTDHSAIRVRPFMRRGVWACAAF